jgi:hypothetical protein
VTDARASRALQLAAEALDTNQSAGPDLALAQVLLDFVLRGLAGSEALASPESDIAASPPTNVSTLAAIDALDARGLLGRDGRDPQRARAVLALLDPHALGAGARFSRDDLVAAEILLRALSAEARGDRVVPRALVWSRRGVLVAGAGAAAAVVAPMVKLPEAWMKYRFTASSSAYGFASAGVLGTHGSHGLLFHTDFEDNPSVVVDLLETRRIHRVTVVNRSDCCQARCLPLVVEVSPDTDAGSRAGRFVEVARRADAFTQWDADVGTRRARLVRLRVEARTYFHLEGIEIR